MLSVSTYSVKIKHFNHIFRDTVSVYRKAVDCFIHVCMNEWESLRSIDSKLLRQQYIERLCHSTCRNPDVRYSFDRQFYKFPSYLRRAAINEAIGKVSSYKSNISNWENTDPSTRGRKPSFPSAGYIYPCMYRTVMYEQTGQYEAKLKVWIRNTWDWITVQLRKSDADYIGHHCTQCTVCPPVLRKRGKEWYLDFAFEESVILNDKDVFQRTAICVDLGINSCATVSVMRADGTVSGRHFQRLTEEYDSLTHAVNRIRKAQQYGNRKTPRLWAKVKGINDDIAVKTAAFIIGIAAQYDADVIVFEHLDREGKKKGSKKQRLHLWRSQYVQEMVEHKAHKLGMRVSHVNAWNTSRLAYDGSGIVKRGKEGNLDSYSLCRFPNGRVYNCDLSASYNIGSRYFAREILKSLPAKARLALEAKVPQAAKRSTCTLSALINLNAELYALTA